MTDQSIITARGVTRRFGGLVALDGIDLDVPRGIVQAIIGPNGSGKTTLLNALSGASHADSGSIRIDGEEIFRLKPHRIARLGLARTFQNIRIFGNLSGTRKRQGRSRLQRADTVVQHRCIERAAQRERSRHRTVRASCVGDWSASRTAPTISPCNCLTHSSACWRSRGRWPPKPKVMLLDEPAAGMNTTESMTLARDNRETKGWRHHDPPGRTQCPARDGDQRSRRGARFRQEDRRRHAGRGPARPAVIEAYLGRRHRHA